MITTLTFRDDVRSFIYGGTKEEIFSELANNNKTLVIKAKKKGPDTNLIIVTSKNRYYFNVKETSVGSQQFIEVEDGEINKKEYRSFNIRSFDKANDTGALEEILSHRFRHSEWGFPNLIVVDGSLAQKNVAMQVLDRYQIKIPVVMVTKNEAHKPKSISGNFSEIEKYKKEMKFCLMLIGNFNSYMP